MKKIIAFLLFVALFSCEENKTIIENENNLLIGNWSNASYKDEKTTFSRVNNLPTENYGISFQQNGDFIERTSGWCGTPPLTFFNIEGTFNREESLINISTNSYLNNYVWRIVSLTETELVIKKELTEQEKDHRELMNLYTEIENLAYSVSCTNANDWTFTPYGAKACGGPQGFIAYSKQIDTVAFLQKIANYTQTEKEYNIKWGIVSDCSLQRAPKSVECRNGAPNFTY